MKKTLKIYLTTIMLFLIPFIILSLILAILSYFMQLSSLFTNIFVQVISYTLLFIASLYFTSQIEEKRLHHCLAFSVMYFLISLLIHLGNIQVLHLILKSFIFIVVGITKEVRDYLQSK